MTGRGGKRTEYHLANFTDEQQVQMLRFLEAPGVIVAPRDPKVGKCQRERLMSTSCGASTSG